jgi:modification methylase
MTAPEPAVLPTDRILEGDCIAVMEAMPAASVDLVFADPPYNLQLTGDLFRPKGARVDAVDAEWDRFADFAAYDAFTRRWLAAARRVLRPDGALWVMGSYHNIYRVGAIVQDLGFWIINDIVWEKSNPMPNFRGVRFTNAHETLLWCKRSRGQKRYTFHYEAMKAANDGVQMRSTWTLALCTGRERLRGPDGAKLHPTQKPEALLYRVLLASTNPGDLVLDPFFGTGTTGAVAKRLGRRWLGIEANPAYRALAQARIDAVPAASETDAEALGRLNTRRSAPRVPVAALLEHGLIAPGTVLAFDRDPARSVVLLASGEVRMADGSRASIHAAGRAVAGLTTCNGWERWYYPEAGALHPLERLRERLRAETALTPAAPPGRPASES